MVRTTLTLSIDSDTKEKAQKILNKEGIKISNYFEKQLKGLIERYDAANQENKEAQEEGGNQERE